MRRFYCRGIQVVLVSVCLVPLLVPQAAVAAEPTFRDLARKYFKDGEGADLAKLVGYSRPVKQVIALEYKVLLCTRDRAGKLVEKAVDPKTHEFKVADRVRITVEPLNDYYVYIFHIGASGQSGFLLPTKGEDPPLTRKNAQVALPDDGFFEFSEPPGEETLLVVATEKPIADRTVLARVLTKPASKDTPEEKAVRKTLKATRKKVLKSVRERSKEIMDKFVMYRGLAAEENRKTLVKDVRSRGVTEGTIEEPGQDTTGGTSAIYASVTPSKNARLLVTIPLKSVGPKRPKP